MKIVGARKLKETEVFDLSIDHEHHSFLHESGVILHNCAFVIADEPISNFIPITTVGGSRVTQFTAETVESSGGLKMDFLIVNSLRDIGACLRMVQDRHGLGVDWSKGRLKYAERKALGDMNVPGMQINGKFVPHIRCVPKGDRYYDIYDLPEDQAVFREICESKTETVFQLGSHGAQSWLKHFDQVRSTESNGTVHKGLDSIETLSAFTALDRPGGLDEGPNGPKGHPWMVEFARRSKGELPQGPADLIPILQQMLPETFGVIVYQEQLTRIFQTFGQTTGAEADEFRVHVSKKQMAKVMKDREVFDRGAVPKLGTASAARLWETLEAWARYGFNKSHAVCYMVVAYACAYLKHFFPLEWWTAVLRNAERNEINEKFWPHCGQHINFPDIRSNAPAFEIVGDRIQAPMWLLLGIGDKAQEQITECGPYTDIDDFCRRIQAWRVAHGTDVIDKKGNPKRKLATTALNNRVIMTMIISGAMDSLFLDKVYPQGDGTEKRFPMTVQQKLEAYRQAAIASGLRKAKELPPPQDVSPLEQYQLRKQILPALTEPLDDLVKPLLGEKLVKRKNGIDAIHHRPTGWSPRAGDENWMSFPIASAKQLQQIATSDTPVEFIYSAIGYVTAERRWRYDNKSKALNAPKTIPAVELTIDVQGTTLKAVKWPVDGILPAPLDKPLVGAIVVAMLSKRPRKTPTLEDILVVRPSLDSKLEEASPETGNE